MVQDSNYSAAIVTGGLLALIVWRRHQDNQRPAGSWSGRSSSWDATGNWPRSRWEAEVSGTGARNRDGGGMQGCQRGYVDWSGARLASQQRRMEAVPRR